jgi:hypothetical protein
VVHSFLTRGYVYAGVLLALAASACSGGDSRTLAGSTNSQTHPEWLPPAETCESGAVRACGVQLDAREGVVTCYKGSQTCDDGGWSECANGSIETKSAPSGSFRTLSLSSPVECADSPCDPGCEVFEEKPADPIESVADDPIYEWNNGSLAQFPNGLVKKGLVEPCETGLDCQFNTYCAAPSAGSCTHSVCQTGDPLKKDCSDCVTKVCAKNATCCEQAAEVDTCDHDPCARGASLKNGCNSCVTKICAANPSCCDKNGTWNDTCVNAVASVCGNTCECAHGEAYNGRCYQYNSSAKKWDQARSSCQDVSDYEGWDLVSIGDANENTFVRKWGDPNNVWIGFTDQSPYSSTANTWKWTNNLPSGTWKESPRGGIYTAWTTTSEPGSDRCAIMEKAKSGAWNGKACSDSYAAVCEGPPEKMVKAPVPPPTWSSTCVNLVATECDADCDESDPTNTAGSCTPWYPGETDPACAGIDLAVGVPCDGVIPVCNHGKSAAPSGVKIVHFPANSQQYPLTNPSQSHPQMQQCFTSKPIPPGECIDVTSCPGLNGNREIMVNPGSGVTECSQADNWSLYSKGAACGAPICAGGNSSASIVKLPVDIIVAIDNSASMQGEIESVQNRINNDLASIVQASGIDYRVIMVSRYGNVHVTNYDGGVASDSAYSVCIGAPLSSIACPADDDDKTWPVANTSPRFYHHSTDIGSNNMWCRLLESYKKADSYPVARTGWTSVAPAGWSAFLREGSFKIFVGITDDDPYATTTTTYTHGSKTLYRDCPNMLGDAALDGTNDEEGAKDFDTAIRRLDPDQFQKDDGSRNYAWYSIAGMTGSSTTPLKPTDPIEKRCCRKDGGVDNTCQGSTGSRVDDAANSGVGYQYLSKLTGGLRYPSCYHNNFNAIFNAIAQDVIVSASASCDVVVESDTPFDPALATVVYSSIDKQGKDVSTRLTQVANAAACTSNAWYPSATAGSSTIKLCPTTCTTVKADTNARVWAELACGSEVGETVQSFIYESQCRADQSVVWLDLGYESTIPSDASIAFRARVAADKASLKDADWVSLRTAKTATAHCPLGAACAVDVYTLLGADNAILPALELEVSLNPSSSGGTASLTNWDLTYSCTENQ